MLYADSSALVKLAYRERESDVVAALLWGRRDVCSSVIAAVEVVLAARKELGDGGAERAERVLRDVNLLELDEQARARATRLTNLRTLDAIHLGTALALGDDLEGLLTYDRRLAEAAADSGLTVLAPG